MSVWVFFNPSSLSPPLEPYEFMPYCSVPSRSRAYYLFAGEAGLSEDELPNQRNDTQIREAFSTSQSSLAFSNASFGFHNCNPQPENFYSATPYFRATVHAFNM